MYYALCPDLATVDGGLTQHFQPCHMEAQHLSGQSVYIVILKYYVLSFQGLTIHSKDILQKAASNSWPVGEENGTKYIDSPDGYRFHIVDSDAKGGNKKIIAIL